MIVEDVETAGVSTYENYIILKTLYIPPINNPQKSALFPVSACYLEANYKTVTL